MRLTLALLLKRVSFGHPADLRQPDTEDSSTLVLPCSCGT